MIRFSKVLSLCVLVFLSGVTSTSNLFAQQATTSVTGDITDPQSNAVVDAKVTLRDSATGATRTTESDASGHYQFLLLQPSTYSIRVEKAGFRGAVHEKLELLVATTQRLDIRLELGEMTQSVEVSAAEVAVNTTDATLGHTFDDRQIKSLPFEGRNPVDILSLQPGVAYTGPQGSTDPKVDSRSGSVNGGRSDQANLSLDGLDDNDQLLGKSFTPALRATLESTEEFRVTTSNASADAGRSSGAQVNLITKSGTNDWHGAAYEYNRVRAFAANDWFNKHTQLSNGQPNTAGNLVRNTFGGTFGGPIKKDRLFFFGAYEGQRTAESSEIIRAVPSDSLRDGVLIYQCDHSLGSALNQLCPGGKDVVTGLSGKTYDVPVPFTDASGTVHAFTALSPGQIAGLDKNCTGNGTCPLGPGVDPAVITTLNKYPHANTDATASDANTSDNFNIRTFAFSAPAPQKLDAYIFKMDYNLSQNGNHKLFLRGNLQNDRFAGIGNDGPQFPGQAPRHLIHDNSKGIAVGYTAVLSNTLVNNLRYGFVRQGLADDGNNNTNGRVSLRGINDPTGFTRSVKTIVPVHNLVNDTTWTKGKHTIQFGGNFRIIGNNRNSFQQSFTNATTNVFFMNPSGIGNQKVSLDPSVKFPAIDGGFRVNYDFAVAALAGLVSEVDAQYNRNKAGIVLPQGTPTQRHFRAHESDFYVQDSWRATPSFTATLGLHYSLLQPPYETNGLQVSPNISLGDWFNARVAAANQGILFNQPISFDLSGQGNGKKPIWGWDYKNIAPRVAFAYSPNFSGDFLKKLTGGPGKSSIRAGFGMYYDHFGEGIVNTFDRNGEFGLSTFVSSTAGVETVDIVPRYTGPTAIPQSLAVPPPPNGFPAVFPIAPAPGAFAIAYGLDDKLKTPYSYAFDLSIARELPHNFTVEVAYVGRLSHRLLQEADLAAPVNVVDPLSKMDYFTAATMLTKLANAGTKTAQVQPIPFWEHFYSNAAGGGLTATQAVYNAWVANGAPGNETLGIQVLDSLSPTSPNVCPGGFCSDKGPFLFYSPQFASLYAWRSTGVSGYNALQASLRKKFSAGLLFDLNYTYSKVTDVGSNAERVSTAAAAEGNGGLGGQIVNAFSPRQLHGPADFDLTHQVNANWVYELPLGHGKRFASGLNRGLDAAIGGWEISGLYRWTSGFPFSVVNGIGFPTNFQLPGNGVFIGPLPKTGSFTDSIGAPNAFKDPTAAFGSFRSPFPGESGTRNELRGPGYFDIDARLAKSWSLGETRHLRFSWEVFNLTNSVRFDAQTVGANTGNSSTFGEFGATLTKARVMQFALRFEF